MSTPAISGVCRSAARAELGAVRWGPAVGAAAGAAALAGLDLTVWREGPGSPLAWLSAALLASAAALALDQPAGAVTEAAPYALGRRLAARLLVAGIAVVGWAGYAGLVAQSAPSVSWPALAVAGSGLVLTGPALAVLLGGPDNREPGSLAASLLVAVVVGLMVVPLPAGLRPFDVSGTSGGGVLVWAAVAASAVAVLARAARA